MARCFRWERPGELVGVNDKGFVRVDDKKLARVLQKRLGQLCDAHNCSAPIPRDGEGKPSVNPEHWGIWPGCEPTLWAWREVMRMAAVARMAGHQGVLRPAYETLPSLRSMKPDLVVYRSLGTRLFRPPEGRVFIAGRIGQLRARAFAAVCRRGEYCGPGQGMFAKSVLRKADPLAWAAEELFVGQRLDGGAADHEGRAEAQARAEFRNLKRRSAEGAAAPGSFGRLDQAGRGAVRGGPARPPPLAANPPARPRLPPRPVLRGVQGGGSSPRRCAPSNVESWTASGNS